MKAQAIYSPSLMKKFVFLFLLFPVWLAAQHCPYDYESVIVLDVRCDVDSQTIPGLKITLQNANGNVIMSSSYNGTTWETDTSFFWLNTDTTTFSGVIDNKHAWSPWKTRFWFADDNYVLVCPRASTYKGWKIRIEDVDGKNNCGKYRTTVLDVSSQFVYPLCTAFSYWDMGAKYGFVKDYKPYLVELMRK